ncbi:CPBP family intramembrane glutamic endopeptidase [Actinorugispora endophytica]|uniref:CAAX prenyl protease-like protein n=1 Tax=Actinorugispora endophytica TaxID=1605990 RepID=A0A4R6UH09_9ACTN|nr:CPBP family intramembrane glutamic endopeptidase [Actinorugispora endophytica]TDQ46130.1 CAAX prenyl protease-like protein [Actinorugispora endophytica]
MISRSRIRAGLTGATATKTVWPVLLTIILMVAVLLAGQPLGAVLAVLAVYLWRRFAHRPWAGVGLPMTWSAVPLLLLGAGVTVAALLAANAASVALGAAVWVPWEPEGLVYLPLVIAFIIIAQAFPEELIWRGNLYDMLADRLSPRVVLVLTSVGFGAFHVFSRSEAQGAVEVALYAAGAVALGFVCAASRERTGTIWMAVGVHSGIYFGNGFFPTEGIVYSVQLAAQALAMVLAGLLVLGRSGIGGRAARSGAVARQAGKDH